MTTAVGPQSRRFPASPSAWQPSHEHATLLPCTRLAVWWWRSRSWPVLVKSILPLIVYTNSRLFHVRRNYVSISNLCTNILHVLDKQIVNLLVPVQLKSNRLNKDSDFELQFFCERLSMGPNFETIKPCRPIWVSSFLTAHQHNIGYAVPYY